MIMEKFEKDQWVKKKTWNDFRAAGLIFFINLVLHAFGWAIVVVEDDAEPGKIIDAYPARVRFRGFNDESQTEEHEKIAKYLAENAPGFPEEIK